jgi:antibiotic biosynthesis monooxygenase (ABM) superfamily enzyme
MIKGIMGYKIASQKDLEPVLMKLRSHAMQYPGYVSAENLVSEVDSSVVIMIITWETIENWRTWVNSRITQDLLRQAETLLKEKPRLTVYRIMPTVEWR